MSSITSSMSTGSVASARASPSFSWRSTPVAGSPACPAVISAPLAQLDHQGMVVLQMAPRRRVPALWRSRRCLSTSRPGRDALAQARRPKASPRSASGARACRSIAAGLVDTAGAAPRWRSGRRRARTRRATRCCSAVRHAHTSGAPDGEPLRHGRIRKPGAARKHAVAGSRRAAVDPARRNDRSRAVQQPRRRRVVGERAAFVARCGHQPHPGQAQVRNDAASPSASSSATGMLAALRVVASSFQAMLRVRAV